MTTAQARIDQAAIASLATAVVGVIAWPILRVGRTVGRDAFTRVGFLALSRINRNGHRGR